MIEGTRERDQLLGVCVRFLSLAFCAVFAAAYAGTSLYGAQPANHPEITAERLDRAVDFILSQDPPFITHGSLFGECPFWKGGDPQVFVICLGFWTRGDWPIKPSPARCRDLSIWKGTDSVPTGRMYPVSWKEDGTVSFDSDAEDALLAVLKACDRPPTDDLPSGIPETGDMFVDFLTRKTVRLGKRFGHAFGSTNTCGGVWTAPATVSVEDKTFSFPFVRRLIGACFDTTALDREAKAVAKARIQVFPSVFDAEAALFRRLGFRYEWGSFREGDISSSVGFARENGVLFALPNGKSNSAVDDRYLVYAVRSNVLVEAWADPALRKPFAAALLEEGWKAGAGQSPKSTIVEYGDNRFKDSYTPPDKNRAPQASP